MTSTTTSMRKLVVLALGLTFLPVAAWASPTFVQERYRWRSDDGSESTATWKADPDTAITGVVRGENIRLRFSVANTSTGYSGDLQARLEYATSTNGTWTAAGTDGNGVAAFEMTTTTGYANGDATTAQLAGSGTFVAGKAVESPNNTGAAVTIGTNQYSNCEYCFRATAQATGSTTYYFRVTNTGGVLYAYSTYATLTMAAGEANEAPAIRSALTANASLVAAFSYQIVASGTEPITYGASSLPAGLSFVSGNTITGTPTSVGSYSVPLTATSAWGSDAKTLAITVFTNLPPVAKNQSVSVVECSEISITLPWEDLDDPDLGAHRFTIVSGPAYGTLRDLDYKDGTSGHPDRYCYRANPGSGGNDSFTWKCSDGHSDSGLGTCSINITPNTAPAASDVNITNTRGTIVSIVAACNDPDPGQTLFCEIVTPPAHGLVTVQTDINNRPCFVYRPWGYWGADSFTWRCWDGGKYSRVATVSISMQQGLPAAYDQDIWALRNKPAVVPAHYCPGTDHDALRIVTSPANGNVQIVGHNFQYVPATGYVGADSFKWAVSNEYAAAEVIGTCSVWVMEDATQFRQTAEVVTTRATAEFNAFYAGAICPRLTIVSGPSHGTVSVNGKRFSYTPDSAYRGPDRFVWESDENLGATNRAVFDLVVRDANERAGTLVLLVVNDALLPEISSEVSRLTSDLEHEGYTAKIAAMSATTDPHDLWWQLKREYSTNDQILVGAIVMGNIPRLDIPFGYQAEVREESFRNMQAPVIDLAHNDIWVSRIQARDYWGWGGEVTLMKRYLQANHDYRTGAARLPHKAYTYKGSADLPDSNASVPDLLKLWPAASVPSRLTDTFTGCDYVTENSHGNEGCYDGGGIRTWTIFDSVLQVRVMQLSSCGVGLPGGISEQQLFTRRGGHLANTWSGGNGISDIFAKRMKLGDSWGACLPLVGGYTLNGDFSIGAMPYPDNAPPTISAFTVNTTSGTAPLTAQFTASASDPDGVVAEYEWFLTSGYNYGWVEPTVTNSAGSVTYTYAIPHRYPTRVQAIDNYKAVVWKGGPLIIVNPEPGKPVRVNCGRDFTYYAAGQDYADVAGNLWLHDQTCAAGTWGYSGGNEGYVNAGVSNTVDDALFQHFRTGPSITYSVPAANGGYTLRLGFAEMQQTAVGQRLMDVAVQGTMRVTGLDVFAMAGAKAALVVPVDVAVTNGMLSFTISKSSGSPNDAILNCFEILPGTGPNQAPVAVGRSVATVRDMPRGIGLTATDADGDPLTYGIVTGPGHGSLSGAISNGWVIYGPATGYAGPDSFTFRANDGRTNSSPATVSVTVRSRDWVRVELGRGPDGRMRVQFPTETDADWQYWVEWCENLTGRPAWLAVTNAMSGAGAVKEVMDSAATTNTAPQRFYRLRVTIP